MTARLVHTGGTHGARNVAAVAALRQRPLPFLKRVPADIQAKKAGGKVVFSFPPEMGSGEPIRVTGTIGAEIKVSLRTRDPDVAKARIGLAQAQFQAFCEAVRRGPASLTHAQVIALSGVWYRRWVTLLRETPGSPRVWQKWIDLLDRAAAKGAVVREIGPIVDEFLAEERLTVDEDSRERLCDAIHKAMKQAGRLLHRFAEGDYRPDPTPIGSRSGAASVRSRPRRTRPRGR